MNEVKVMTSWRNVFILGFLISSLLSTTGCFMVTGYGGGMVVPELSVKGVPTSVVGLSLTVTGPKMNPVVGYFSPVPDNISIEVPAGTDRQFDLTAYFSPLSAVLTSRGSATADLVAGESRTVDIRMIVEETKLVIPDTPGIASGETPRLVQIDDMSGTDWQQLVGSDIGWLDTDFRPYDVDFDSKGNIYIANQRAAVTYGRVLRVDDITGANLTLFPDKATSIVAIAVDQYNDYLYYSSGSALWRVNLDGTNDTSLSMSTLTVIRGMDVGEDGLLYIAGSVAGAPAISVYDPVAEIVAGTYNTNIATPWDTYFRSPHVYVANLDGPAGNKVIQIDESLSFVDGYGSQSPSADSVVGNFYGPKRFVGILPKKLVILDEGSANDGRPFQGDRLISIEDLNGVGWQSYGTTGNGIGQFHFYWAC